MYFRSTSQDINHEIFSRGEKNNLENHCWFVCAPWRKKTHAWLFYSLEIRSNSTLLSVLDNVDMQIDRGSGLYIRSWLLFRHAAHWKKEFKSWNSTPSEALWRSPPIWRKCNLTPRQLTVSVWNNNGRRGQTNRDSNSFGTILPGAFVTFN